jgi:hypothetical protein
MPIAIGDAMFNICFLAEPTKTAPNGLSRQLLPIIPSKEQALILAKLSDDGNGFGRQEQDTSLAKVGHLVMLQYGNAVL